MDVSSYSQGILAGGVLIFPSYDNVPPAQVVQPEQVNVLSLVPPAIILRASIATQVTGQNKQGINQNFPNL